MRVGSCVDSGGKSGRAKSNGTREDEVEERDGPRLRWF